MPRKHNFGFSLEKLDLSSVIICVCIVILLILTVLILVKVDKSKQHYCPRIARGSNLPTYNGQCPPGSQCWADPDQGYNFQVSGTASNATLSWLPSAQDQPTLNPYNPSSSLNLGQLIDDNGNPVNDINLDGVLNKYHILFSTYTVSSVNGTPVSNGDTVRIKIGDLISNGNTTFTLGSYNISLLDRKSTRLNSSH